MRFSKIAWTLLGPPEDAWVPRECARTSNGFAHDSPDGLFFKISIGVT